MTNVKTTRRAGETAGMKLARWMKYRCEGVTFAEVFSAGWFGRKNTGRFKAGAFWYEKMVLPAGGYAVVRVDAGGNAEVM